jgi:hypothetical protein
MREANGLLIAGALLLGGAARGDIGGASSEELVAVMARGGPECPGKGAICARAGAASTVQVPSEAGKKAPAFKRTGPIAAHGASAAGRPAEGWSIELGAQLLRPALAGNAVFAFYDLADPHSVEHHEVTAMAQSMVPAGKALAVRAHLSGEDGFRAGHTYRVRVAQILGGHEVLLAAGDFALE